MWMPDSEVAQWNWTHSYVDEQGRRIVWVDRATAARTPGWALDLVARVRGEVAALRRARRAG